MGPDNQEAGFCPIGGERSLTSGEIALAKTVFGTAIDYSSVKIKRRKWMPFQPRKVVMAPRGNIHFHPYGAGYCDDFSTQNLMRQGLFIHEMVHVWQAQVKGSWWLVFHRMPWTPYHYSLKPGWPLENYGIEQQAEIVKHAFWLRNGVSISGISDAGAYDLLVQFPDAE